MSFSFTNIDISGLLEFGGWVVAGIFVLLGMFGVSSKARRDENDSLTQNLITNLTTTVETQKVDIASLRSAMTQHTVERQAQITTLTNKITHLEGRNSLLEDLFKGRDPDMQQAVKRSPQMFAMIEETNKLVKDGQLALTSLTKTIEDLVKKMPRTQS